MNKMTALKKLFTNQWPAMVSAVLLMVISSESRAAEKPNVIVIMADDLGFSDLGCYGSEINTPNLDSLATNGIRFSQMYNSCKSNINTNLIRSDGCRNAGKI